LDPRYGTANAPKILGLVAISWLVIADQSELGIFHPSCIHLGQVHSDAVDYPKSGNPVKIDRIPKLLSRIRPDWSAPETVNLQTSDNYYPSFKAIGKLFRAIDLPALDTVKEEAHRERRSLKRLDQEGDKESFLEDLFAELCLDQPDDHIFLAVEERVSLFIDTEPHSGFLKLLTDVLAQYTVDLHAACVTHCLSREKDGMLTEAEAVIGTIVAKCPQRRKRKDAMADLRDQTACLVKFVRSHICGEDESPHEDWLARAWAAWRVSQVERDTFGANSFGWIALGEIFDSMKAIEDLAEETKSL